MAVHLETKVRHYLADSEADDLPRVGMTLDGHVLDNTDLPIGSTVLYRDTGRIKRWNGSEWSAAELTNQSELLLSAILAELRDIRERIALAT